MEHLKLSKIIKELSSQQYDDSKEINDKFKDCLFPPEDRSLYSVKIENVNYEIQSIPKFLEVTSNNKFLSQFALDRVNHTYYWKQLSEVYDLNTLNINKESDYNRLIDDVIQGELGDCYFLSALSALAQNPKRISNLIRKSVISHNGVYEVHIFIHGQLIKILIDDYFPFMNYEEDNESSENKKPQLAFAKINPKSMNIWPIILEKAWAKCNLSYEDIASGNSADAFKFLTPSPIDTYYHNVNTQNLFALIQNALLKKYIVVCDMTDIKDSHLDYLAKMGLITNHGYSITETVILKDKHDKEIYLLKISNRWKTNKWVGDWSNYSEKWTDQYKETCHLDQKAKTISWICFEDYIQYYTTTHICHLNDEYHYVTSKFQASGLNAFDIVSTYISIDTTGYFIVNLKNSRIYYNLKGLSHYENHYCQINVFRKENGCYYYIGSDSGRKDRLYVYCDNMVKGIYYISVTFPKKYDTFTLPDRFESKAFNKMSFRVGVYSPIDILDISLVSNDDMKQFDTFFEEIIHQIAKSNTNMHKFVEENENNTRRTVCFQEDNRGYSYIYYENHSEAFLREKITLITLNNVNIIPRFHLSHSFNLSVMEDEEEIEFEDHSTEELVKILKQKEQLISSIKSFESESSNHSFEITVAPKSSCLLILQKTDDEAEINFNSQISFDYVCSSLLAEQKYKPKKQRLKYNNKPIEIFECITEYNTGVLFQYKNRTSELKISINATFTNLDNLYLSLISDDLKKSDSSMLRESISGKFRKDKNEEEVLLTVSPGETKFFDIRAIDIYKKFSFSGNIEYQFRLSKGIFIDTESSSEDNAIYSSPINVNNELNKSINTSFQS